MENTGNLSVSRGCLCLGTEYSFYCLECCQFQNQNYELQRRLSGVLPNQQSRQKYVRRYTCVACGTLLIFHYSIMWLSRWCYGEALWRGFLYTTKLEYSIFHYSIMRLSRWRYGEALWRVFLYTTKLESKFILRPTGIPPPGSLV